MHHRPKVGITHEVRITFRKERITQKSPFCLVDKRDFFVGAPDWIRTSGLQSRSLLLYPTGLQARIFNYPPAGGGTLVDYSIYMRKTQEETFAVTKSGDGRCGEENG